MRGKAEIRCARDLYNFAEAKLKTIRSHNCKRRIYKYIEEVERNNKSFQSIRGIRAIHRIETLDSKRVLIRNLSCHCESCIAADGVEPCLNLAQVGNSDETVLRISPGPDNDQETDRDDIVEEQTESVADLISKGTIFAVLCNDDQHDFFLIKALSGVEVLSRHETDLWGASFPPSALVIRGLYFTKKQNNILQYKLLKNPPAIVPCESVLYICQESSVKNNLFCLTEDENNNILECVNLSALTQ
jgi:predicted phosphohydrolase